jgi:hypothetical protein
MTSRMFLAERLSGLNLRSRLGASARARRSRVNRRLQVEAQISLLEERCMLSRLGVAGIPLPTPTGGFVQASDVWTTPKKPWYQRH